MIHFKGIGEHSVFELEKIILEQKEQLHQIQIEIQKLIDWISIKEKLLSDIENILERNLLLRDEDSETVEKITELFKNSERPQLKWHFKK